MLGATNVPVTVYLASASGGTVAALEPRQPAKVASFAKDELCVIRAFSTANGGKWQEVSTQVTGILEPALDPRQLAKDSFKVDHL